MSNPSENPYEAPQTPTVQVPPAVWPPTNAVESAPCFCCGSTYARKIDFTWWGGHYRGKLWLSGRTMPLWVRMRPDRENDSLRIVLFMYGNGRRIVEMRAERVPK